MHARIAFARKLLEFHCRELQGESGEHLVELRKHLEVLATRVEDEGEPDFFATFGLSIGARRALTLLAAAALDFDSQRLAAMLTGSATLSLPAIRHVAYADQPVAVSLADLDANGALRRFALIERCDGGAKDLHDSKQNWAISSRMLRWWAGDRGMDVELQSFARIADDHRDLDAICVSEEARTQARDALAAPDALVVASGEKGNGRRTLLCGAAHAANMRVLVIDAPRLATDLEAFRRQMRLVVRECRLLDLRPLLCNIHVLDETRLECMGRELGDDLPGTLMATCGTNPPALRWDRPTIVVEVNAPTSRMRAMHWLAELGQGTQEDAEFLATQYPLAPALIHHAAKAATARASGRAITPEDIYRGIRAALDDKLGGYARRVEITQTWDDVVLPDDQMEQIQYLISRIRQRRTVFEQWGFAAKVGKGLGTSALFSGPPGTGKTMVCALIARELGLELYQVDMAKVTSKYIGETEQNLAALFDAAEAGHAILLFDEADSLFGKRTDVKSSNDRYANLETNYLLQRLERFTGICLLTSNHESSIDAAFHRRLSLHVRFDVPDVDERAALWQAVLPPSAPVAASVDFVGLAKRFAMSGGYIRNAALRAAFAAADQGSVITAQHLVCAAKAEYEAMGKIAVHHTA